MAVRAAICGRNLADLRRHLAPTSIRVVSSSPDVVISYGGDGSLLGAERDHPGVPKCPLRDSRANPKCAAHSEEVILNRLAEGTLVEERLMKIEADAGAGNRVVGLNDVFVSKEQISSAVRYRIWLGDEPYAGQIVGDGLVVATPFGSTGYYRSITHSMFRLGLGLAFNNSTEPTDHLVVEEDAVIRVQVIRGPAVLLADNAPAAARLGQGDEVIVRKSAEWATVLGLDAFRCPECHALRQRGNGAE